MTKDFKNLGSLVFEYRSKNKLTLTDLSKKIGISIVMLYDIENGKRIPTKDGKNKSLSKLSNVLKIKYEDLVKLSKTEKLIEKIQKLDFLSDDKKNKITKLLIGE